MIKEYFVQITAQAYEDLAEIIDWYSLQRHGLEKEFAQNFELALKRLQENPLGFPIIFKGARSIFLHKFPYKIVYKNYGNTI